MVIYIYNYSHFRIRNATLTWRHLQMIQNPSHVNLETQYLYNQFYDYFKFQSGLHGIKGNGMQMVITYQLIIVIKSLNEHILNDKVCLQKFTRQLKQKFLILQTSKSESVIIVSRVIILLNIITLDLANETKFSFTLMTASL